MVVLALLMTQTMLAKSHKTRISIFADHIVTIAQQEKIPFEEAARRIKEMGYEGVDVRTNIDPQQLETLDRLGFQHACAIADLAWAKGDIRAMEQQALDFCKREGYKTLLYVPVLMPQEGDEEAREALLKDIQAFARKCKKQKVDVMVEDYDNKRSICLDSHSIGQIFQAAPTVNHVFDTGNYLYAGEDAQQVLKMFRKRIHHVHLKDRNKDMSCPAVGHGMLPIGVMMDELSSHGYRGWWTVEHFGSRHMLQDAEKSIRYLLTR